MAADTTEPSDPDTFFSSPVLDTISGHIHASALRAVVLHGIPDLLASGPRTPEDLAVSSGIQADPLRRVLRLLAMRGLFREDRDGTFVLTEHGTSLRTDVPESLHAAVLMYTDEMFRVSAEGLADALRTGETSFETAYGVSFFEYLAATPEKGRLFDSAMSARTSDVDEQVRRGYHFPAEGTIVDVGGGRGGLLREVLTHSPGLTGILFDLPETVRGHMLDDDALAGRWSTEAGDMFTAVPEGADLYLLKYILHDWSDEDCLRILDTLRRAVTPGTRLLVIDAVLPVDGSPHPAVALDVIMLMMLHGRERTASEFENLLSRTGFRLNRILSTPTPISIVEAEAV